MIVNYGMIIQRIFVFFVGGFRNGIFKSENVNSFFKEEDFMKDEIDMVQD